MNSIIEKMLTKTQIEIIGYLLNREEPQNIRGIARALRKSYTLVYNNIENLRRKEIIYKQEVPPAQIIKLNEYAPVEVFIEAEDKRKEDFLKRYKEMGVFLKDVFSNSENLFFILIVFGSYAKGKTTKKSDMDFLAIVPRKEDIKEIEVKVGKSYTKIKKHLIVVDQQDFLGMIKKPKELNIGNEARKNHIILYGVEQYYQLIKRGE